MGVCMTRSWGIELPDSPIITCTVDGCERPHRCRGLCELHERRWRKHGDPLWEPPTTVDRFWGKVEKTDACWLWTAAKDRQGYGRFRDGKTKRTVFAHRYAYELLVGPIPDGLTIDHLCKVVACVNPAHMEPVPNGVNAMRGSGAGATNAAKTHCSRGHEFNDENTYHRPDGGRQCRACARITEARLSR